MISFLRSDTPLQAAGILYFSTYYTGYNKKDNEDAVKKAKTSLRTAIGSAFEKAANEFAKNAGNDEKGKPIFKKKNGKDVGVKYLTQAGIIKYIENNIKTLVPPEKIKEFINKKNVINAKGRK
ncbi:hypothetical protein [Treponema endosymbiont of Eucomonympha sp.]|uniref:hypothetical protein n=1 Tax=Treponema endosymbiont of Eucomonympha sp. TaxID=1580831 RepID=UPI0007518FD6|nr:hypothetical protein [Treponema endosymbiont of Eucomonympha sp.]